jgi:anti-anti-sigma regulatory factor
MNITVEQAQGRLPVTVLGIHGDLDGSNYQTLVAKAKEVYDIGARDLILDMSDMPFMSSAGLVALHGIALLMRNEKPPDPDSGWEAFHAIGRDQNAGAQQHVKLFNPQPKVSRTLEMTGMNQLFEIHTDLQEAIASF